MSDASNNSDILPVVDVCGLRATLGEINLSPLFAIFIEDADIELKKIDSARLGRDREQFLTLVHGLKGACATIYALRMKDICRKLEHACQAGNWEEVDRIFGDLESALASVQTAQV